MDNIKQISRMSYTYRLFFTLFFISIPITNGFFWGLVQNTPDHWITLQNTDMSGITIMGNLTLPMRFLAFLASMIKGGVMMYGVWVLMRLFKLYENGQFFDSANIDCFKLFSRILIWWVISGIVTESLMSVVLTMNNPPGQRMFQIGMQSADVTALVIGGILSLIARVMEKARKLQEESQFTV